MDTAQTVISTNFDDVKLILKELAESQKELKEAQKETDRQIKEHQKENDRLMKENDRRMKENDRQMKEAQKETERQMKETDHQMKEAQKETDRQMKETDRKMKETDRQMKETDRQIKDYNRRFGDFTRRFGEVVEYMIAPGLCKKFNELGYNFLEYCSGSEIVDPKNDICLEIDIKLQNTDKVMLVEVKTKLTTEDVKEHVMRMEKMREYANLHNDNRTFYGAVAGVVMTDYVKSYALKLGFFVIEPSGDSMRIISPQNDPKEW